MCACLRNDPQAGIKAGIFPATASAIHGLITPLFKEFIGQRLTLSWGEEMARKMTSINLSFGFFDPFSCFKASGL